jgi:hypothetical protein
MKKLFKVLLCVGPDEVSTRMRDLSGVTITWSTYSVMSEALNVVPLMYERVDPRLSSLKYSAVVESAVP